MKGRAAIVMLAAFLMCSSSCGGKRSLSVRKPGGQINGAGATFPYPVYSKWFYEYAKINKDAKINYQSIGSGGGIRQITEGTVDFGASDSPMSNEEIQKADSKNGNKIIHIPTVIGSVVITYNIPGIDKSINLTPEAISGIYLGNITKWNDPAIQRENAEMNLPDKDIIVTYRTDGSGTTFVFTDFLGKVNAEWKSRVGSAKDVKFPVGQGGKGNEGVTGLVEQLEYSIGYVEFIYAIQNNLKYASVKNSEGEFISPSLESLTMAAEQSSGEMPPDLRQSITNAKGKDSYPISSYTYILIYENQRDSFRGKIIKGFLQWALNEGGKYAKDLGYAPLPSGVREKALEKVNLISF